MATRKIRKNEYIKTVIAIFLIIGVVLGLFFGLEFGLHTSSPALTVISPSMYIANGGPDYTPDNNQNYDTLNDFWISLTHPFSRTLNVGDIIIIQRVNSNTLNTHYPNSNIIVFHDPEPGQYNTLIVHRIVSVQTINGTLYFITKGDGNGNPWPQTPQTGFDPWDSNNPPGVPANYVEGKVIFRIPWFGWVTLFMRNGSWGLPAVITLIMILVVLEFVLPEVRKKPRMTESPTGEFRYLLNQMVRN